MKDLTEKTLEAKQTYQGKILNIELLQIELPDGRRTRREVVRHGEAVGILARRPDGKFVFVRQYRKAVEDAVIEIIAGGMEKGEDPETSARRETAEETGYEIVSIKYLTTITPTPGYCDEKIHLFYAELSEKTHGQDLDPFENVEPMILTADEIDDAIRNRKIYDAKTLSAWACYRLLKA